MAYVKKRRETPCVRAATGGGNDSAIAHTAGHGGVDLFTRRRLFQRVDNISRPPSLDSSSTLPIAIDVKARYAGNQHHLPECGQDRFGRQIDSNPHFRAVVDYDARPYSSQTTFHNSGRAYQQTDVVGTGTPCNSERVIAVWTTTQIDIGKTDR